MPIDYNKYPSNWKTEIRPAVLRRAKLRCENCGLPQHAVGYRQDGVFKPIGGHTSYDWAGMGFGYPSGMPITYKQAVCFRDLFDTFGERKHLVIVLTIAHLDHDTSNNDLSNLKALCQKCHLEHDKDFHAENRRNTLNKKKGLIELPFN